MRSFEGFSLIWSKYIFHFNYIYHKKYFQNIQSISKQKYTYNSKEQQLRRAWKTVRLFRAEKVIYHASRILITTSVRIHRKSTFELEKREKLIFHAHEESDGSSKGLLALSAWKLWREMLMAGGKLHRKIGGRVAWNKLQLWRDLC